jgi:acetoin utilization deacetylase AcuC-like enzyme
MTIGFRECTKMPELRERTLLEVGGTILAAQLAYKYGLATNCAGGTHHASPSCGAGYTIINDLAVTANFLLRPQLNGGTIADVHKVLVIDCDVHQGDGTARFVEEGVMNETEFVTCSIHCENNYPTIKANSTYDIGLPDYTEDAEYLETLKKSVTKVLDDQQPDFVLYDAGVDVHKDDFLGRLNLSDEGIRQRDVWVFETCVQRGIPVVGVIGGGYDKDSLKLARRHSIVHEAAAFIWRKHHLWDRKL